MMFQPFFELWFSQFLLTNLWVVLVNKYMCFRFELFGIFILFVNSLLIRYSFCPISIEFITFNAERI